MNLVKRSVFLVALSLSVSNVVAQEMKMKQPPVMNRLKLFQECFQKDYQPTKEQINMLEELSSAKPANEKMQAMAELRKKISSMMESEASDKDILSVFKEMRSLETAREEAHLKDLLKIRKTMSHNQKKSFRECREKGAWKMKRDPRTK